MLDPFAPDPDALSASELEAAKARKAEARTRVEVAAR